MFDNDRNRDLTLACVVSENDGHVSGIAVASEVLPVEKCPPQRTSRPNYSAEPPPDGILQITNVSLFYILFDLFYNFFEPF